MSKYKIVEQWQFACDFMSVIRVHAFPVVLNFDIEPVLVSPAYPVFKIKDHEILDPEYLMMWFRRSEFDRYADFKCDSAIRGGFGWEEMCDIELPIPSIEKQREIVREYNMVNERIMLNEQLIQKLDDTAQTIYKQWFVDFDFPISKEYAQSINKPNLEGQPYKSSGGKMEFCNILGMEKPICIKSDYIENYVKLSQGQVINTKTNHLIQETGLPLLRIQDLKSHEEHIFMSPSVGKTKVASRDDIIVSRTGIVGLTFRHRKGVVHNNCFKVRTISEQLTSDFLFWFLKSKDIERQMFNLASGSVQADLSHQKFNKLPVLLPDNISQNTLSRYLNTIENRSENHLKVIKVLNQLRILILKKMSKA